MIQRITLPGLCIVSAGLLASPAMGQCTWGPLADGVNGPINVMTLYDDGFGEGLYVGGLFTDANGLDVKNIAWWDGGSWSAVGDGFSGVDPEDPVEVYALAVFDDGNGPALYAGGVFGMAGTELVANIAMWNGAAWTALGDGITGLVPEDPAAVYSLGVFDDGGGPALYAGGMFEMAGGGAARNVAKWDGTAWSTLRGGMNDIVRSFAVYNDGSGDALYAGGDFTTSDGTSTNMVAKWDGSDWSPLLGGMNGPNPTVNALAVFNGVLYAGGIFTTAGGDPANNIAKWNGSSWSRLKRGTDGPVQSLAVYDDGLEGADLYAGGLFTTAGRGNATNVAKWSGRRWAAVGGGSGIGGVVNALAVYDDGARFAPGLFAAGSFSTAGGETADNITKLTCRPTLIASLRSFEITKGTLEHGTKGKLKKSDNRRIKTRSDAERLMYMNATFKTNEATPRSLRLEFESKVNEPAGRAEIRLKNWVNGKWITVGEFSPVSIETTSTIMVDRASRFVNAAGKIKMKIRYSVWVSQGGGPFNSFFDQIRVIVSQ